MAQADWSIVVGVFVFIIAIVAAIVFYLKYKKISLIVFTSAIATYVFAVFYTWDVFDPNQNVILLMLAFSAVLMMGLAKYFANFKFKPAKMHTSLKEKENK